VRKSYEQRYISRSHASQSRTLACTNVPAAVQTVQRNAMASVRCSNYALCHGEWEPEYSATNWGSKGVCVNCDVSFGRALTFINKAPPEECITCFETESVFVAWPGCRAAHSCCVTCFKRMVWPQREYCDGMCGYENTYASAEELGVDVDDLSPRVAEDCVGRCRRSFAEEEEIKTCQMCRAPREDPVPLWGRAVRE
jgi:hypothetical protein